MDALVQRKNAVDCGRCVYREVCGGLDQGTILGCFSQCISNCQDDECDLTCPNNLPLFSGRMAEIDGSFSYSPIQMKLPKVKFPPYVPAIHNGSGRICTVKNRVVAIPLRAVARTTKAGVECRFENSVEMRDRLRIARNSAVVVNCVTHDHEIERVWEGLRYGSFADDLALLHPAAVIVPNYSFFTDVPRTHTLYNRKRILIAARILSAAGCPVIVHLSSLTPNDWAYWARMLADTPQIRYIAKEFQTGHARRTSGVMEVGCLCRLQQTLGRPLHPIAIGGRAYAPDFRRNFDNYTILDSRPFFLSIYRRRLTKTSTGKYVEAFSPTGAGEPIDDLLAENIRIYEEQLQKQS